MKEPEDGIAKKEERTILNPMDGFIVFHGDSQKSGLPRNDTSSAWSYDTGTKEL